MSTATSRLRRVGVGGLAAVLAFGIAPASADADFQFTRVYGDSRYETSAEIAALYGESANAILASGETGHYPDALSANYLAGQLDAPILLTRIGTTPEEILAQLEANGVENVYIVGGPGAVSAAQEEDLVDAGYDVTRVYGDNRFETSEAVLAEVGDAPSDTALIATGFGFADALAGGPLAYTAGMPMALSGTNNIRTQTLAALEAAGVDQAIILGGTNAISSTVQTQLEDAGIDVVERLQGATRSGTSVSIANYAVENNLLGSEGVNLASGAEAGGGADALSGGPLTGEQNRPLLISYNATRLSGEGDDPTIQEFLVAHAATLTEGLVFGGPGAISDAVVAEAEEAAQSVPTNQTFTSAPELTDVEIVEDDVVAYVFDESVTGKALDFTDLGGGDRAYYGFRLYSPNGTVAYPYQASISGSRVLARYDTSVVSSASLATVRYDAVEDVSGVPNVEGDFALQPEAVPPPATAPFSPQLTSVGNYRLSEVIIDGVQRVLVDFVFTAPNDAPDLPAALGFDDIGGAADEFFLVGSNSDEYQGLQIYDVNSTADETTTTTTITVAMAGDPTEIPQSQLRRGYVVANDDDALASDGDGIVLAERWETLDGTTVDPDLVSVQRVDATNYRFEFDEAVSDADLNELEFFVFDSAGDRTVATSVLRSAIAADEARVVLAQFPTLASSGPDAPVDAFVAEGAVRATDSTASENAGYNRPDEEVVTLPAPEDPTVYPAGETELPDLMSVARDQNVVTGNYSVTFTFDGDVTGDVDESGFPDITEINFDLYDENGTQFQVSGVSCATVGVSCSDDGESVTFSIDAGFSTASLSNEQIAAAVTAGVEDVDDIDEPGTVITEAEVGVENA